MNEDIQFSVVTEKTTTETLIELIFGLTSLGLVRTMSDLLDLDKYDDIEIDLNDPKFDQFRDVLENINLNDADGATIRYQLLLQEDGSLLPTVQVLGYDPDLQRGLQYAFFSEDEDSYERSIAPYGLPAPEIGEFKINKVEFGVYLQLSRINGGFSVKAFDKSQVYYDDMRANIGDLGIVDIPSTYNDRVRSVELLRTLDRLGPISQAIVKRSDRITIQESTLRLQRGVLRINAVEQKLSAEAKRSKRFAAIAFLNRVVGFAAEVVDYVSLEGEREKAERSQKEFSGLVRELKTNARRLENRMKGVRNSIQKLSDPSAGPVIEVFDAVNSGITGITTEWSQNEKGFGAAIKIINRDGTEDYHSGVIILKD